MFLLSANIKISVSSKSGHSTLCAVNHRYANQNDGYILQIGIWYITSLLGDLWHTK